MRASPHRVYGARMIRPLALLAMLAALPSCGAICGPEPPQADSFDRSTWGRDRERIRWESCMGYLPDPAVPVRIVR